MPPPDRMKFVQFASVGRQKLRLGTHTHTHILIHSISNTCTHSLMLTQTLPHPLRNTESDYTFSHTLTLIHTLIHNHSHLRHANTHPYTLAHTHIHAYPLTQNLTLREACHSYFSPFHCAFIISFQI